MGLQPSPTLDRFWANNRGKYDTVITASSDGIVTVFRTGDEFSLISSVDFGEPIMATPAVASGTLYVRTDKALYAFGKPLRH